MPPGTPPPAPRPSKVFAVDPEAGVIRFGDGARGTRPPLGATLRADYDVSVGRQGNVGPSAINAGPTLPAGFSIANPVPTWGGADAESVTDGEKQIPRYLQHRDRLVTADDFDAITRRAPGVDVGRVDVLPAFHPDLPANEPGDAPGVVTVMVLPKYDAANPDAPQPDRAFLDTVSCWLEPRRLVTTAVYLRGPVYKKIWLTVGIEVIAGFAQAQVREDVKAALKQFLAPLPPPGATLDQDASASGWPLRKNVIALELLGVANRVHGVRLVSAVQLAGTSSTVVDQVPMVGLELPRLVAIDVAVGDAMPIADLIGQAPASAPPPLLPVPFVPEECQ